jgi:hypothetical protein
MNPMQTPRASAFRDGSAAQTGVIELLGGDQAMLALRDRRDSRVVLVPIVRDSR